ncbi:hypothetical protein BCV70DRAFT_90758 [Testicularia cyperi]|uniref:DUF1365-domain-containing protein n=1 Tax=Testicularia cyperi TaxID=1882483 RepID=A0A317XSU0_9BASI|nr:hypothetical protein BCV70DRAFT_90758 [Testicularia cyperi]
MVNGSIHLANEGTSIASSYHHPGRDVRSAILSELSRVPWLKLWPLWLMLALIVIDWLPAILERLSGASKLDNSQAKGFVVPARTDHARFLPTASKHGFSYNTLYLALRLDALESHLLDTGLAFGWKGGHYEPEYVEDAELAQNKLVAPTPTAKADSLGLDAPPKPEQEPLQDWKQKMRTAERRDRRRRQEDRRRKTTSISTTLCGIHPSAYLRNHFDSSSSSATDKEKMDSHVDTPELNAERKGWISGSILLKLAYELRQRGFLSAGPQDDFPANQRWQDELGHVWTVTMPSIAGITGINPLTIHYCYRTAKTDKAASESKPSRGDFWLVVLEVHNTFSERHIYVLEADKSEDPTSEKRPGYDHQWTFPRSFHVSPFNDRGGYYRLFLKEPFRGDKGEFVLGVRLLLLVEDPSEPGITGAGPEGDQSRPRPKLVKKLMATLDSGTQPVSGRSWSRFLPPFSARRARSVRPLTSATLCAALIRQPLDLFLTFARILFQAGKLHFSKRLDAFGRPDMVQVGESAHTSTAAADGFSGIGLPPPINRIQPHRDVQTSDLDVDTGSRSAPTKPAAGGLVYPDPGWAEKEAKLQLEAFARRRVDQLAASTGKNWTFVVEATDPADCGIQVSSSAPSLPASKTKTDSSRAAPEKNRCLRMYTRSYAVYTDLLMYSHPRLALLLGSCIGRRWGVSSIEDFDEFFNVAGSGGADTPTPTSGLSWADSLRIRYQAWIVRLALDQITNTKINTENKIDSPSAFNTPSEIASLLVSFKIPTSVSSDKRNVQIASGAKNPIQDPTKGFRTFLVILLGYLAARAEKSAFDLLGARYVRGTEPWLELYRALVFLRANGSSVPVTKTEVERDSRGVDTHAPSWDTRLGSVRSEKL